VLLAHSMRNGHHQLPRPAGMTCVDPVGCTLHHPLSTTPAVTIHSRRGSACTTAIPTTPNNPTIHHYHTPPLTAHHPTDHHPVTSAARDLTALLLDTPPHQSVRPAHPPARPPRGVTRHMAETGHGAQMAFAKQKANQARFAAAARSRKGKVGRTAASSAYHAPKAKRGRGRRGK
jgi:hypothetical protein